MTTLADVNATLGATNIALAGVATNTEKTNEGIVDFLDYLKGKDAVERRQEIENKRETRPLLKNLKTGAAAIGGGLVTAGKSTFGFGKGLLSKLAIPAGFLTGFLANLLSSKLLRFGVAGLGVMFGDEIAEFLTGPDAEKEVKNQVSGAIKGGALGLLLGPRFAIIGSILGGLFADKEVDKQAGELVDTLRDMEISVPSMTKVFKTINTGVADGLKGINSLLKGDFDLKSTTDALKLIGGAALLVSPAGSFFLLRSLARSRIGRLLITIGGLGLVQGAFGGDESAAVPDAIKGNRNQGSETKVTPAGEDVGGFSSILSYGLNNALDIFLGYQVGKGIFNLGKGIVNVAKKVTGFGKNVSKADDSIASILKDIGNKTKTPKAGVFSRMFSTLFNAVKAGGKFGLTFLRGFPLLLPATIMAEITSLLLPTKEMTKEQNLKQNILKMTGNRDAKSTDLGIVEDFGLIGGGDKYMANTGRRMNKVDPLVEFFARKAGLENAATGYNDRIMSMVNSNNTTTNYNSSSSIAMDQSGAFDQRDNLANQLSY